MIGRALRAARVLNTEQRVAAGAALLLIVSTFGPFSFVEVGELLIGFGILALLYARAEGMRFHLPFGDGTVIAAAGVWAGALIVARLLERPLGQNLLALGCAALLFLAGARERAKHPMDDIPAEADEDPGPVRPHRPPRRPGAAAEADATTEPLPPPEFKPYEPHSGEQLHLGPDEREDAQG
ncbi:MAG TPA: hypothetical protein VE449_12450 [Thermoleophilaceae bacterium]|nr:hypothetical protein [Thermoleophilaceae bacterium]